MFTSPPLPLCNTCRTHVHEPTPPVSLECAVHHTRVNDVHLLSPTGGCRWRADSHRARSVCQPAHSGSRAHAHPPRRILQLHGPQSSAPGHPQKHQVKVWACLCSENSDTLSLVAEEVLSEEMIWFMHVIDVNIQS